MAVSSRLPVLPLSIHGTYEAAEPGKPWFRGGPVTATIHPPIPTDGLTQADADALRDRVRELIAERVSSLGGEVG
jgi:1-acyl-sn-glycerol-3-phosphate acyltransferase